MTPYFNSFQIHIDPRLYNYKWEGPKYATVVYLTDGVNAAVETISGDFSVLGMISAAGMWGEFAHEVIVAAEANLRSCNSKGSNVHPTIISALAPFINS